MEENLVGYLLKALDPVTQREVDEYLRTHPEARRRLEALQQALAPLAADKAVGEPPPGLRYATLARVAEYRCRDLPYAPPPPPSRATIPIRSWWRWPDAAVAAAILFITVSLVPLVRYKALHHYHVTACQNNLRQFHQAFLTFAEHHGGHLPKVEEQPPRHFAGVFVPLLNEECRLSKDISIACPSKGRHAPSNRSLVELEFLHGSNPVEYRREVARLAGCYAYSLGYRDATGVLHGLSRDPNGCENDRLPIMADRPPFDSHPACLESNSRNHNNRGQNVLFLGGNAQFFTLRTVGINGDDIYLNLDKRIDAGRGRNDTVLAASSVELERGK